MSHGAACKVERAAGYAVGSTVGYAAISRPGPSAQPMSWVVRKRAVQAAQRRSWWTPLHNNYATRFAARPAQSRCPSAASCA